MEKEVSFQKVRYDEKRQRILESAGKLFAKKGYEKASLEEIAAKLKLKKGTLYYYIKSKEDMLFQIQMQSLEKVNHLVDEIVKTDMSASEKLVEVIKATVKNSTRAYVIGCINQQEFVFPEKMKKQIIAERRRYHDAFLGIIQQGVKEGVFEEDNWKMRAFGALGAMNWVTRWYSSRGELSPEEIGSAMADFVLKGFGKLYQK
jgi:TetR/AcrR family transcriptional regulator, cholesterol catabolism regulator